MNQGQKAVLLSNKEWRAHAEDALREYLVSLIDGPIELLFTMEDFRCWMANCGLPEPNHPNCWGAFTSWAKREKLIKWTGRYSVASLKAGKGHAMKVWRVVA